MTDRLIRLTTALAVVTVAAIAAVISYQHAYELVRSHGEAGFTARLAPLTVDGLIVAASMLILDANRRSQVAPRLAQWCLGAGICTTICANLAHGMNHGSIGALVSAWPALALAGSFELLMLLVRGRTCLRGEAPGGIRSPEASRHRSLTPALSEAVKAAHADGHSQRAISRQLGIDRRRVKKFIDQDS